MIAGAGAGFLYYISRTGITGARAQLRRALGREVEAVKRRAGGILQPAMFEIPSRRDVRKVVITAEVVNRGLKPLYVTTTRGGEPELAQEIGG